MIDEQFAEMGAEVVYEGFGPEIEVEGHLLFACWGGGGGGGVVFGADCD